MPLAFAAACSEPQPPRSIVLIVVDTLRADRVGARRDGVELTPNVDRLSSEALRFASASAPAPLTMPSVAALLTGKYPDRTGVVGHTRATALAASSPTLAELARAAGYETAAVVANPWLASRATRFHRGFDHYVTARSTGVAPGRLVAKAVTGAALGLIESSTAPLLLWVHYIDAHMPYQPPREDAAALSVPLGTTRVIDDFVSERVDRQDIYFAPPYPAREIENTRRLYDASVRAIDREIGRLLEAVDRRFGRDRTIVVFTADHGESLGEHALWFAHDFTLYEELTRVPLVVRLPSFDADTIEARVSLVDVLPTLCEHAPFPCPPDLDGEPLTRRGDLSRETYSVGPPFRTRYARNPFVRVAGLDGRWASLREGDLKLIRIPRSDGARWEAYDLDSDPAELHNVYSRELHAAAAAKLESWLGAQRAGAPARGEAARPARRGLERDTVDALRALGYLD